jgi:branched-chain amino acid transport system permease protein
MRRPLLVTAGATALAALLPLTWSPIYLIHLLLVIAMYVTMASAWNLLGGFTGYPSFGHGAFFGLGAYTTAILFRDFGLSPFLTAPAGGLVAAAFAAAIGYPTLRLREEYFAIATMSVGFILQLVARNWDFTGGGLGLYAQPPDSYDIRTIKLLLYLAMLAVMLATLVVALWVRHSRLGFALAAIRDGEEAAGTLGVPTVRLKMLALILSTFFPGAAGGLWAYYITYIDAEAVFEPSISINVILMSILGGAGTVLGPVLGAALLVGLGELVELTITGAWKLVLFGAILIAVVLRLPGGLLGWTARRVV